MQSLRDQPLNPAREGADPLDGPPSNRTAGPRRAGRRRQAPHPVDAPEFRERLLSIMDRKHHWAWQHFSGPAVSKAQLLMHFQQEFATYVRDFPVLLARIHGKNPPMTVRRMLAENIYEEDTGGLSFGKSHPELFLAMMRGLGYTDQDFHEIDLLPAARAYRNWLDRATGQGDWVSAAAVMAIFVEGSVQDRREILQPSAARSPGEIERIVRSHPLVRYHGASPVCMDLTRAHQAVEAGHRQDAYAMVLDYARDGRHRQAVVACVEKSLARWLRYRDAVARACGLTR
jgi:pyrroloquinoline-quinone synthase